MTRGPIDPQRVDEVTFDIDGPATDAARVPLPAGSRARPPVCRRTLGRGHRPGSDRADPAPSNPLSRAAHRLPRRYGTNRTNTRTVIAALVPGDVVITNQAPYMLWVT
jgi:hypothetical protein